MVPLDGMSHVRAEILWHFFDFIFWLNLCAFRRIQQQRSERIADVSSEAHVR